MSFPRGRPSSHGAGASILPGEAKRLPGAIFEGAADGRAAVRRIGDEGRARGELVVEASSTPVVASDGNGGGAAEADPEPKKQKTS